MRVGLIPLPLLDATRPRLYTEPKSYGREVAGDSAIHLSYQITDRRLRPV